MGGRWHWEWIFWRDLARLQDLLGVSGRQQRDARRGRLLQDAQAWLQARRAAGRAHALAWEPYRMGPAELQSTPQVWALNEHDRALLRRLLSLADPPQPLRVLCEAMQRVGKKAEQESWL